MNLLPTQVNKNQVPCEGGMEFFSQVNVVIFQTPLSTRNAHENFRNPTCQWNQTLL